uniref:DnaJ domain-containing protein, putative n=2 Tax=Neospora caninum (strain Liverpool) TaxID=572307 RepID=A0A0F7U7A9_NEOCL|nr:TPA: DnaJ domain-containing protein, putative [Neospora caninum Liverpool]
MAVAERATGQGPAGSSPGGRPPAHHAKLYLSSPCSTLPLATSSAFSLPPSVRPCRATGQSVRGVSGGASVRPSVFSRSVAALLTLSALLASLLLSPLSPPFSSGCAAQTNGFLFAQAASHRRSRAEECPPSSRSDANPSPKCAKKPSSFQAPPKTGACPIASRPPATCEVAHIRGLEGVAIPPVQDDGSFDAEDIFSFFFAPDEEVRATRTASSASGDQRKKGKQVRSGQTGKKSSRQSSAPPAEKRGGKGSARSAPFSVDPDEEPETEEPRVEEEERMYFDPYEILGVPSNSSEECIRLAYRQKAKLCHPDTVEGRELRNKKDSSRSQESKGDEENTSTESREENGTEGEELAAQSTSSSSGSVGSTAASPSSGGEDASDAEKASETLSHAEKFMLIRSAFELLSNKTKRRHFDRHGRSPDEPRFLHREAVERGTRGHDPQGGEAASGFGRGRGDQPAADGDIDGFADALFSAFADFASQVFDEDEAPETPARRSRSNARSARRSRSSGEKEYEEEWSRERRRMFPGDDEDQAEEVGQHWDEENESEVGLEEDEEEYESDLDFRSLFDEEEAESSSSDASSDES